MFFDLFCVVINAPIISFAIRSANRIRLRANYFSRLDPPRTKIGFCLVKWVSCLVLAEQRPHRLRVEKEELGSTISILRTFLCTTAHRRLIFSRNLKPPQQKKKHWRRLSEPSGTDMPLTPARPLDCIASRFTNVSKMDTRMCNSHHVERDGVRPRQTLVYLAHPQQTCLL